jgi:SAM-dependent methyltransferase
MTSIMQEHYVNHPLRQGCIDRIQFERCGLVRVEGWLSGRRLEETEAPKLFRGGAELPLLQAFHTYRPDVASALGSDDFFQGVVFEYATSDVPAEGPAPFRLTLNGEAIFEAAVSLQVITPDYGHLLDSPEVLHREQIYGVGPPSTSVIDEVFRLAAALPGPLLDFGCGSGALVGRLRRGGVEAYGIELERGPIIEWLLPEVKEFVRLYGGGFPLPYGDGEFESVFATEVIEHVPDYEGALGEIARISRRHFTVTVPDASAIPICHHNNVVPWHLLESTHVNFFTQRSLERLLKKYFPSVKCARLCPNTTNDSRWFTTLVGVCSK